IRLVFVVAEQRQRVRQPGPGERVTRVELDGTFEEVEGAEHPLPGALVQVRTALRIEPIRLQIHGGLPPPAAAILRRELRTKRPRALLHQLTLEVEDAACAQFAIVPLGPAVRAGSAIDHLHVEAEPLPRTLYRPLH